MALLRLVTIFSCSLSQLKCKKERKIVINKRNAKCKEQEVFYVINGFFSDYTLNKTKSSHR